MLLAWFLTAPAIVAAAADASSGWTKDPHNPVLGGGLGTCFDVAVLRNDSRYQMFFSWRPKRSIALVTSTDGVRWRGEKVVLAPNSKTGWEDEVNRPYVIQKQHGFHMWYTGQAKGRSWIGYATSLNAINWDRKSGEPVLSADQPWEKVAVMCPDVIWNEKSSQFRMWYSGGDQYEPDAIGYATSPDGLHWTKHANNPVFKADPDHAWERHKVTACHVVAHNDWYYMFYIGFRDVNHAQIGLARSRDGITNWERLPANPIIGPTAGGWDADACYKPFAIFDPNARKWMLWYNGRRGSVEQIGLATLDGEELWRGR